METVSMRCANGQHRKCPDCGCRCHVTIAVDRSVRVKNIKNPFHLWTGKVLDRASTNYWRVQCPISATLFLNLTFHESELELLGGELNG